MTCNILNQDYVHIFIYLIVYSQNKLIYNGLFWGRSQYIQITANNEKFIYEIYHIESNPDSYDLPNLEHYTTEAVKYFNLSFFTKISSYVAVLEVQMTMSVLSFDELSDCLL